MLLDRGILKLCSFAEKFWVLGSFLVLIKKEWFLERRDKSLFAQTMLFEIAAIFTIYLLQKQITDERIFSIFLWLVILFSAFQLAAKNFSKDNESTLLFVRQYASADAYIFSKIVFNYCLLVLASFIGLILFIVLFGFLEHSINYGLLISGVVLGAFCLSAVLSFVSAIGYKAGNSAGLTAVLGFPLILPGIMFSVRIIWYAMRDLDWSVGQKYVLALLGLNLLILALVKILFPYLWRD